MDVLALIIFGLAIGLAIGTVGGGGAVLAVPVLVYVAGLGAHEATTASLAVVAAGAVTGALGQSRRGAVCWKTAAWFASAAVIGSVAGTALNQAVGGAVLLYVFSAVMLLAARATWQRAGEPAAAEGGCPEAPLNIVVPAGAAVGVLTGLVGVGGGFVIVPALAIGLHLGLREAMGTSMVIVFVVSIAGLISHLGAGQSLDADVALPMAVATVVGAVVGPYLSAALPLRTLGRGFAGLVVVVAVGVGAATAAGVGV